MIQCYNSLSTREKIRDLQEAFITMKNKYKETGNQVYKSCMEDIQTRLRKLGE